MKTKRTFLLVTLASVTLTTACGTGSEKNPDSENAQMSSTTAAQATTGESGISPTGYRKPGAPVRLLYSVPPVDQSGTTVNVEVSFAFEGPLDSVNIAIGDSEDMDIMGPRKISLGRQRNGDTHTMTISVIPWENGLHFVNVFADTQFQGRHLRRTFAVPIEIAGAVSRKKAAQDTQIMPDGEVVIPMPAQEEQPD